MDMQSLDSNASGNFDTQSDYSRLRSLCSQPSSVKLDEVAPPKEEKPQKQKFAEKIAHIFNKNSDVSNKISDALSRTSSKATNLPEVPETANKESHGEKSEESSSSGSYEEMMKTMENRDQGSEMPNNLPGGVVLDQLYAIASSEMNSLLFSPDSTIIKSLADVQKTTELQIGPWKFENGGETLKRVITCTKSATKLVKALKATEEQTYLKADGRGFAVLASVSTPDAPYGGCFKTEVLYCITPGPDLPSGEQSSQLVVSWRINFLQSTMMKGMIENGAKQGIRDSFEQFTTLLAERVNPADVKGNASEKEQALASLQGEPQSDWKLAIQYFGNLTCISAIVIGLYVLVHLFLATPSTIQGLEFVGLDLPDSIGELIVSGVFVLQGERFLALISRFMQARRQKGRSLQHTIFFTN